MQWRPALCVADVDVCPSPDEDLRGDDFNRARVVSSDLHNVRVPVNRREEQRRTSSVVYRTYVSAPFDEKLLHTDDRVQEKKDKTSVMSLYP